MPIFYFADSKKSKPLCGSVQPPRGFLYRIENFLHPICGRGFQKAAPKILKRRDLTHGKTIFKTRNIKANPNERC